MKMLLFRRKYYNSARHVRFTERKVSKARTQRLSKRQSAQSAKTTNCRLLGREWSNYDTISGLFLSCTVGVVWQ